MSRINKKDIVRLLKYNLEKEGYTTLTAHDGEAGLDLWRKAKPDLILLDLMLPKLDGIQVCRAIRQESQVPIIMVTAKKEEIDRILGLELGADDYVSKPFSVRELLARIRALLRRTEVMEPGPLVFEDLSYEPESREIVRGEETVRLTVREGALFELLLRRRGKVVSRSEIQARIWEDSFDLSTNIIDVYINALRKKIDGGDRTKLIQTVRGVGYRVREPGGA